MVMAKIHAISGLQQKEASVSQSKGDSKIKR